MKMVKSLLLGTAAGLLAVAGAQAADMPVKAKPVEYVKVCSLYGAGFYYIPGTDTCLKIGGYVRVQTELHGGSSGQADGAGGNLRQCPRQPGRRQRLINWTARAVVTLDARTQTDYGTLRSYIRAGWNQSTPGLVGAGTTPCNNGAANNCLAYWDRAFIQFAGFTVGRGQSFFDLFTYGGAYTYLNVRTSGDTGAAGVDLWAYTVQFGNGVSYTLSLEDPSGHGKAGTCDNHARVLRDLRRVADATTAWSSRAATTTASGFRTSSPTCASTRPGAISVSAPRSTTSAAPTTAHGRGRPTASTSAIRRTSTAGRSRSAACSIWPVATSSVSTSCGPTVLPVTPSTRRNWQNYNNSKAWALAGRKTVSSPPARHRADQGLEHQRGLPAHLGTGGDMGWQVADDGVRRLRQRLVQ